MALMTHRSLWFALLTAWLTQGYSIAQWEWHNPLPQGNTLTDIHAFSTSACYAVGERGTFLRSTSGGGEWSLTSIQGMPDVTYVQCFDQTMGILLGNRDTVSYLFRTTDSGEHWTELHPSPGRVTSTFFLNSDTGWAATSAALLFSIDGGASWSARTFPGIGITRLFFLDARTGWALQQDSVFRTIDGGVSWLGSKPDSMQGWIRQLNKIIFVSPQTGWLIGTSRGPNHYSGHLFKSTDGGAHWAEQLTVGEDFVDYRTFSDIEMRSEQLGWAVSAGRAYKTTDGGNHWKEISNTPYLSQISPSSDAQLWGCGSLGALYFSDDGGANWTSKYRGSIASLNDLYWLDQHTGFAAGDTLLLKTRDAGTTWETLPIHFPFQDYADVHAVWFVDSLRGWIGVERSGGWGSLLLTTDGGRSWKAQLDSVNRIFRLFFFGDVFGWASSGNKVYRTTDRGATWHQGGASTDPGEIESLFFTSPDSGWAGGYLGVAQTTDGGISWTTVMPGGTAGLYVKDIFFFSSRVGWLAGYSGNDGHIFKTEDGGKIWQSQQHPTETMYTWFLGVGFGDMNRGWTVGQSYSGGFAYQTTDGGGHWEVDDVPLNRPLLRVKSQGQDVWILGAEGAILHRSSGGTSVQEQTENTFSPTAYMLEQNYPNPFNPLTIIKYTIGGNRGWGLGVSDISLVIYDVLGREVAVLVNERKAPGAYEVHFDGSGLSSGVYFYRLVAGAFTETRKLLLIR